MLQANIMDNIVDRIDVSIFCKDLAGKYTFCNERFAKSVGLESEHVSGLTDFDLIWREQGEHFLAKDKVALEGKPLINVPEMQIQHSGIKEVITSRIPLYSTDGTIEGIIGYSIDITGTVLIKKEGVLDPSNDAIKLGPQFGGRHLKKNEVLVYYYLLLGLSASQIGDKLHFKKRKVQYYIETLKDKLGCESQSDLIAIGIRTGLSYTVLNCSSYHPLEPIHERVFFSM